MRRTKTNFVTIATLALFAGAACSDATAPVPEPPSPPSAILGGLLTGDIVVATTTTGSSLDPNGYVVSLDVIVSRSVATNGSVTFPGVLAGAHVVGLSGVAANCTVSGGSTRVVTLLPGSTARVAFTVSCAPTGPTTGNLTVTTGTTGSDLDPDGYTVTVDGGNGRAIGTNGSVTYTGLAPGNHSVALSGVAGNCTVSGANPRTVSVTAGSTAGTTFSVSCAATGPTTGDLAVTTGTTGSDLDPDGYTVTLDGTTSRAIAINGSLTFTGLSAGNHSVALSGVAGNCTVSGANPRTVTVTAGSTASTTFSVSCAATGPTTGDLTVGTATTGSALDPDGYTVTLDGTTSRAIGINGSVTFTGLAAGDHSVALSGVAGNCTVSGANPRTVTVTAGGTASTTFSVSCAGTPPPGGTRVTGRGAMGPGTATPGSDRQEFDFEATDAPAGRAVITDYSVIRPSGSVGRMIVDRAADPATGVTAFSRTSAACVRFEGMGRLDTGELWRFIIDACDNGSPGAGADTFTISLPDRMGSGVPFVRSGTLREGDIVISTF